MQQKCNSITSYTVWVRKFYTPKVFLRFIFQRLKILKPYFTRVFGVQIYAKLQSFVQLVLNLMKLCHIIRAHLKIVHFHLKAHFIVKYKWPPNLLDFNHLTTNVWSAMLQIFNKLNLKPKTILELKVALQQIRDDLPQTFAMSSEFMCFGRW